MTSAPKDQNSEIPLHALPEMPVGGGFDCLEGIRVLDLTTSVAGPVATLLLADMGAEVVKVERPGAGDDARAWGPPFLEEESLWFLSVNRNKKSICIDQTSEEGRAVLRELIKTCDVIVLNQPPRVSAKLGLSPDAVRELKPDIVYVSISGFGLDGERADWTSYDLIAEGYSGVMDLTGAPGGEPQKVGAPAADMLAGQDAAFGAISALFARARTGKGRVVEVSLIESMTRFLACRIVPYLGSGEVPRRSGGKDSVIAIYQAFETADRPLTLGLGNDGIWRRFWEALGDPQFGENPDYASNRKRRIHRDAIVARIQEILRTKPRAHWLELFVKARIPAGPINQIDEVAADRELQRRRFFYRMPSKKGPVPQVGTGIRFDGQSNAPRSAPPTLGEHTGEILSGLLGYDEARIAELKKSGAVS